MIPDPLPFLTAAASLAGVVALIWLAQRAVRAAGLANARASGKRRLILQEVLALDTRRRLHVVRWDGRDVLLMTGGGTDCVVGWLPAPGGEP